MRRLDWRLPRTTSSSGNGGPATRSECRQLRTMGSSPTCGDVGPMAMAVMRRQGVLDRLRDRTSDFFPTSRGLATWGGRGWPWRDIGRGEQRRAGGGARSALRCLTRRRCLNGAQRSEFGDAPPDRAAQRSRAKGAARSRPRPLARQGQPCRPGSRGLPRRPLRQPLRHREAHRAAGIAEHKEAIRLSAENRKNVGNRKGLASPLYRPKTWISPVRGHG